MRFRVITKYRSFLYNERPMSVPSLPVCVRREVCSSIALIILERLFARFTQNLVSVRNFPKLENVRLFNQVVRTMHAIFF